MKTKTLKKQKGGDLGQILGASALGAFLLWGATKAFSRKKKPTKKYMFTHKMNSSNLAKSLKNSNQDSKSINSEKDSKSINNKTDSKPKSIIQEVEEVQSTKPENMIKKYKEENPNKGATQKQSKPRLELKPFDGNKSVSRVDQSMSKKGKIINNKRSRRRKP